MRAMISAWGREASGFSSFDDGKMVHGVPGARPMIWPKRGVCMIAAARVATSCSMIPLPSCSALVTFSFPNQNAEALQFSVPTSLQPSSEPHKFLQDGQQNPELWAPTQLNHGNLKFLGVSLLSAVCTFPLEHSFLQTNTRLYSI
jgi:hypothetical protein